jgi:hypothetical protein
MEAEIALDGAVHDRCVARVVDAAPSLAPFPLITDRLAVSVPVLPMPPIPKP